MSRAHAVRPVAAQVLRGPGRRVPGHRRRAVGRAADGVPRVPPRPHRGPEAGHLRLPRGGREQLPRGRRRRGRRPRRSGTNFRSDPAVLAGRGAAARRRPRRRADRRAPRAGPPPHGRARRSAGPGPGAGAPAGAAPRRVAGHGPHGRAGRGRRALGRGARHGRAGRRCPVGGAARASAPGAAGRSATSPPGTSPCSCAPSPRPSSSRRSCAAAGCRACSRAGRASSPPRRGSGCGCWRPSSSRTGRRGCGARRCPRSWLDRAELDAAGDRATDEVSVALRGWGTVLAERGVSGMFAALNEERDLPRRLLGVEGGERRLTDLRHIAEVLHAESALNPAAESPPCCRGCAGASRTRRRRGPERSRRLDTDRDAVQIATVHTSKGLEYEVVCVPFGWDSTGGGSKDRLPVAHAPDGPRALHVGGLGPRVRRVLPRGGHRGPRRGAASALRRAHPRRLPAARLVAPATNTQRGALHRLLMTDDALAVPEKLPLPADDASAPGSRRCSRRGRRSRSRTCRCGRRRGAGPDPSRPRSSCGRPGSAPRVDSGGGARPTRA